MIRRAFLAGLAASFASRRAIAQPQKPEIGSLLNRGLVKTTLGLQAYFEVHGNPAGPNIYLAPPVFRE
jgi:hypothetical protein